MLCFECRLAVQIEPTDHYSRIPLLEVPSCHCVARSSLALSTVLSKLALFKQPLSFQGIRCVSAALREKDLTRARTRRRRVFGKLFLCPPAAPCEKKFLARAGAFSPGQVEQPQRQAATKPLADGHIRPTLCPYGFSPDPAIPLSPNRSHSFFSFF
jgi:hypothetical protein